MKLIDKLDRNLHDKSWYNHDGFEAQEGDMILFFNLRIDFDLKSLNVELDEAYNHDGDKLQNIDKDGLEKEFYELINNELNF